MAQHPQSRKVGLERSEDSARIVTGGIVDEDHLIRTAVQRRCDLARERLDIAGLVMHRHDDGKFKCFSHGDRPFRIILVAFFKAFARLAKPCIAAPTAEGRAFGQGFR